MSDAPKKPDDPYIGVKKLFFFALILFIFAPALSGMGFAVGDVMRSLGRAYNENQALWHGFIGFVIVIAVVIAMLRKKE